MVYLPVSHIIATDLIWLFWESALSSWKEKFLPTSNLWPLSDYLFWPSLYSLPGNYTSLSRKLDQIPQWQNYVLVLCDHLHSCLNLPYENGERFHTCTLSQREISGLWKFLSKSLDQSLNPSVFKGYITTTNVIQRIGSKIPFIGRPRDNHINRINK